MKPQTPTAAPEPRFANEILGDRGQIDPFQELKTTEQSGCGSGCSHVTAIDSLGSSLQALLCLNGNKIDLLQINFLNCIINL